MENIDKEAKYYSNQKNWDFSKINYSTEYDKSNKFDFYKMINKYSTEKSLCLDLGTGGGENLLKYYPKVGYIIAIDNSKEMIETANNNLLNNKYIDNKVKFLVGDNLNLNFPDNLFDLVSARNTNYEPSEVYKILKKGGAFIIQGVDTKDCQELKQYYNRGQNFGNTENESDREFKKFGGVGFDNVELYPILFTEYYKTKEDLLQLLLKAPIINNFENENTIEESILNDYIKQHETTKGIELKRLYFGIIAIK